MLLLTVLYSFLTYLVYVSGNHPCYGSTFPLRKSPSESNYKQAPSAKYGANQIHPTAY